MGLLTLLDSRAHRNLSIWRRIVRFVGYIRREVLLHVER